MRILIASPVCREAIELLKRRHDVVCAFNAKVPELVSLMHDREAIIFRSGVDINADVMSAAPSLKLLIRAGSGLDNIDMEFVRSRGLHLERIEVPGAMAVAEMSFCLMLALARQLRIADSTLREGRWVKHELEGHLLAGKTLGVYGAGNIGSRVGRMGAAWGMRVVGCVENPSEARRIELRRQHIRLVEPDQLLSMSDFVSLHVPLTDGTRGLFGDREFDLMKPGAILVNLARGGVVDEAALLKALRDERIRGAGLDVHEVEGEGAVSPLAPLDNVLLTPHIGAGTIDSQRQIGQHIVEIVTGFEAGGLDSDSTDILPVMQPA